jgi:ATP-binding cassette, subfamily A (ABC1), member 3
MKSFDATQKAACQREVAYGGKISLNASSPYAVPSVCEGRVSPFKLAIVPDVPFTRQYFFETVSKWYPTVTFNITGDASMVVPSLH